MAYPISDVTRRVVYTGSAGVGPYSFTFEVLANTDIQVYKNTTLLTLTTNYTVTINANGTGSVTLVVAATGADTITIVGDRAIQRATDFVTGGDLFANTLNDEFDSLVIFAQQVDEKADRGLKAPVTDPTDVNMVLPVKASRKGKVLAFDSTSGDPVAGPALDAVTTVIAQSANINTVATNIASVNTVAGNNTNVTTVAGVSGAVTTVAGISANVTTVAGISSNVTTVATNNANVTTVAGISGNVTTVAGISANVTSVAGNSTNINAVAGNSTNINAVNANSTNINTVAAANTAIGTVSTNIASVNTAATNIAAIIDAPNQATAAANSATAAAASAAAGMYSAVQDKSANYTVVAGDAGDLIRVTTTSGAVTITLPTISTVSDGFKIAIVKWTGDANAVTVARSSTNTINGATSATIGSQYSQTIFVADFETNQWFAASSGLGASNVAVDAFSGDNSTVAFTLSGDPGSENNTQVFVSGVYQEKDTYSVSGTTLTFSTAPPTGTSNIEVVWTAPLAIGTPSDGTVTTAKIASSVTLTTPTIDTITSAASTALTLKSAGTTAVTIDTSQNVGIGTSSPSSYGSVAPRLVVTGSGRADAWFVGGSSTGAYAYFSNNAQTSTTNTMQIGQGWTSGSDNIGFLNTNGANPILFATNGAERMRILSTGQVLIDRTTDTASGKLEIYGNSDGAFNPLTIIQGAAGSTSRTNIAFYRVSASATVGTIQTTNTATSYNTSSDYRLKENIAPMSGALSKVLQLKPVTYKWKLDSSGGEGFIAHELAEVCPHAVSGEKDATREQEYEVTPAVKDEEGNITTPAVMGTRTVPVYQGIDTSFLVATLTAAIQELKAINDTQAETINALTARVTALEGN